MSIFSRLKRIARANFNMLLDRAEQPESMLDERIRELEKAIEEGKGAAAMYGATFKRMERQLEELKQKKTELNDQAAAYLKADDEELARKALDKRLDVENRIATLQPSVEQGRETYEELRKSLQELTDQLADARTRVQELKARKSRAEAQRAFGRQVDKVRSTTGTGDGEFEKFENKVVEEEAAAEIENQIRDDIAGSDAELEKRARELQIEAELKKLKTSIGQNEDS